MTVFEPGRAAPSGHSHQRPVHARSRPLLGTVLLWSLVAMGCGQSIDSATPKMNTNGDRQTFTLVGSGFGTDGADLTSLALNTVDCSILTKSSTTATCAMSAPEASGGTSFDVVATINHLAYTGQGILSYKAPTVTSVAPDASDWETSLTVTVSGLNFGTFDSVLQTVSFGNFDYTSPSISMPTTHVAFEVILPTPGVRRTDSVLVTSVGQTSAAAVTFVWTDLDVTGVTPSTTPAGDTVAVDGVYFGDSADSAMRTLFIGGTACDTTTFYNSTRLLCQGVPTCAAEGTKDVIVSIGATTSAVAGSVTVNDCGEVTSTTSLTLGVTYTLAAGAAVVAAIVGRLAISVVQAVTQGAETTVLAWMRL